MKVVVHNAADPDAETVVELALKPRSGSESGVTLIDKSHRGGNNILSIGADGTITIHGGYGGKLKTEHGGYVEVIDV